MNSLDIPVEHAWCVGGVGGEGGRVWGGALGQHNQVHTEDNKSQTMDALRQGKLNDNVCILHLEPGTAQRELSRLIREKRTACPFHYVVYLGGRPGLPTSSSE